MIRILLTYPSALPHETRLIGNLMADEWDFLHARKPDYSKDEMINFLEMIPKELIHKVVLHSHFDLALEFDLAGISLKKKIVDELIKTSQSGVLSLEGDRVLINGVKPDLVAYSAHGFQEIENLPIHIDYVFLSPVFDSISKEGYKSAFADQELLRMFLRQTNKRVIALGGMNNDTIPVCEELGFDGYAMLGYFWNKYFTFVETIQ